MKLWRRYQRLIHSESASGFILVIAASLAMLIKNSPLSAIYSDFLTIEGEIRLGVLSVEKPLFLWVNDFHMAIFFFLIGLEIKREILYGQLSDTRQIILPSAGALGGVLIPALIYISLNLGNAHALVGWAVPTATDIAFALGVLALVGTSVPASLKVFLMTLAIIDDLIAIIIIALFYTSGLSTSSLVAASFFTCVLALLNRLRVNNVEVYLLTGLILWVCVLKSGVHATLAGALTALFIPAKTENGERMLDMFIEKLHPWVAFGILPLFAFVNSGIALDNLHVNMLLDSIPLGISLGLVVGKPLGVMLFAGLAVWLGAAKLPKGVNWLHLTGVGFLCGIGFTMSLFIGGLAFAEGGAGYARIDRLGMLAGSAISAIIGYAILRASIGKTAPTLTGKTMPDRHSD